MTAKRLIFAVLFAVVSFRCMDGQVLNGNVIIPLKGSPTLVQASYLPSGTVSFTPVVLPSGFRITCDNSVCTVVAPVVTIPVPTIPTQAAWITLAKSSADPLTWCVTDQPLQFTYIPSMLHVIITLTVTTVPGVGQYPRDVYQDIQPAPQQGQGSTSAPPPQWIKGACGGNPGVVFPSSTLNTGEQINSVQARVVF